MIRIAPGTKDGTFRQVEVLKRSNGKYQPQGCSDSLTYALYIRGLKHVLSARKEILLSAGTIGTPHILLNSGIGNEDELIRLGINVTLHLPDVGKNLVDHPRLASNWLVKDDARTFDIINQNATVSDHLLRKWAHGHRGPLVDTFVSHLFFSRVTADYLQSGTEPAAGPASPHYELGFSVCSFPTHVLPY